jgi:hypothetical protein
LLVRSKSYISRTATSTCLVPKLQKPFLAHHHPTPEAMVEVDYGYGDATPETDYGYGDGAPETDYGYGDAAPQTNYGYGSAKPDTDYGYGDAKPDTDYGYGDAAGTDYGYGTEEPAGNSERQPVKRRCSVTKYSLQTAQPPVSETEQQAQRTPQSDEKSTARTAASSCASSTDGMDHHSSLHKNDVVHKKHHPKTGMLKKIRKRLSIAF